MNRIFLYFFIFLACFLSSCKNKTTDPDDSPKTTLTLKVLFVNDDATISGIKKNKDEDVDITESLSSTNGIELEFGNVVELTVEPIVADRAILWTGGNIKDADRHNKTVEIQIEKDTIITVIVSKSASPIDEVYLDLLMSDNGAVSLNGDRHTATSKIMFAKNQVVELEAVADKSYYFDYWNVDKTTIQSNVHSIIMEKSKQLTASFKANSVGIKLKLRVRGGSVSINGSTYTEDSELTFAKGTSLNITAAGSTENDDNGFVGWGGDVRYIGDYTSKTVTFNINSSMFLEPIFGNKRGYLYVSFNPPDDTTMAITSLKNGSFSDTLSASKNSMRGLAPGDIITLQINTPPDTLTYKSTPTWSGAGGYGVAQKTTIAFNENSVVASIMFTPVQYGFTVEVTKYVDDTIPSVNNPVGGHSITIDGITYKDMSYIERSFDANSIVDVSLNTGLHFTNISFDGSASETNTNYQLAAGDSKLAIKLGHVSRELKLNMIGGKRTIGTKDYISSITISNSGYATSDIVNASTSIDNASNTVSVKVLSGYNVAFIANLSGGHSFGGYNGLDITNGNNGYFTNASWDKTIDARFSSSEIWDGNLMTEAEETGNTYAVNVPSELAWIANHSLNNSFENKTISINLDLDMNNKPFTGIATGDFSKVFAGSLKGNGKKIKNVFISGGNNVGFVGKLDKKGKVDGVYISSGDISISGGFSVGGIVGSNHEGQIINSSNNAAINSRQGRYAGGIVGYNNAGMVNNSFNYGLITGLNSAGGIVGFNDRGTNTNVGNEGKIVVREGGNGNYFGGIAGNNLSGNISQAYNTGVIKITNSSYVGGIVGENKGQNTLIYRVYNKADVEIIATSPSIISEYVGGIIGYDVDTGTTGNPSEIRFSHAYNAASVRGHYSIGGIVGAATKSSKWAYIYNIGNVSSRVIATKAGAIIGEARTTMVMQNIYYLKTGSANFNLDGAGKLFDNATAIGLPITKTNDVTRSHMGLPDSIWEDKTAVKQINSVRKHPMIKDLGEHKSSKL